MAYALCPTPDSSYQFYIGPGGNWTGGYINLADGPGTYQLLTGGSVSVPVAASGQTNCIIVASDSSAICTITRDAIGRIIGIVDQRSGGNSGPNLTQNNHCCPGARS